MQTRGVYHLQGIELLVRFREKKLLGLCKTYCRMLQGVETCTKFIMVCLEEGSKGGEERDYGGLGRNKYVKIDNGIRRVGQVQTGCWSAHLFD